MTSSSEHACEDPRIQSNVRVLIIDDHDGYRQVAEDVVASTDGFATVGTATSRADALQRLDDLTQLNSWPDLVLMDVNLGADDGISFTEELTAQRPGFDVVLVSAIDKLDLPAEASTCGARGYLPKSNLSPAALIDLTLGVYDWA